MLKDITELNDHLVEIVEIHLVPGIHGEASHHVVADRAAAVDLGNCMLSSGRLRLTSHVGHVYIRRIFHEVSHRGTVCRHAPKSEVVLRKDREASRDRARWEARSLGERCFDSRGLLLLAALVRHGVGWDVVTVVVFFG
jgi:hypothetical protein